MTSRKICLLLAGAVMLLSVAGFSGADVVKFMRSPAISDGLIAFCYHGDIWVANDDGTGGYRLTNHVANDTEPRFSPDGKWVAFSSDRMGNNDIWMVPVEGGEPV